VRKWDADYADQADLHRFFLKESAEIRRIRTTPHCGASVRVRLRLPEECFDFFRDFCRAFESQQVGGLWNCLDADGGVGAFHAAGGGGAEGVGLVAAQNQRWGGEPLQSAPEFEVGGNASDVDAGFPFGGVTQFVASPGYGLGDSAQIGPKGLVAEITEDAVAPKTLECPVQIFKISPAFERATHKRVQFVGQPKGADEFPQEDDVRLKKDRVEQDEGADAAWLLNGYAQRSNCAEGVADDERTVEAAFVEEVQQVVGQWTPVVQIARVCAAGVQGAHGHGVDAVGGLKPLEEGCITFGRVAVGVQEDEVGHE
jgi:hypothetical protein